MPAIVRKCSRLLLALLACASIASCSGMFGVYRVPVQQGNVITVEMLQELELGMNKRKVSFILGTPLVTDAFHLDRWDYFYSYQPSNGQRVQQTASLYFEQDRLTRIDADIDSKIDFHTVTQASDNVLIVPPRKKGGFLAAITPGFLKRDEAASKQEAIARTLSTGVNPVQPGSGLTGSTRDAFDPVPATSPPEGIAAATAAAAAAGDGAGDGEGASAGLDTSASASPDTSAGDSAAGDSASAGASASGGDRVTAGDSTASAAGGDSAGSTVALGTPPREIYAPNTSARIEGDDAAAARASTAPRPVTGNEVMSAETRDQSKFLQQLFAGFGSAKTPATAPAAQATQPAPTEPAALSPATGIRSGTTRD